MQQAKACSIGEKAMEVKKKKEAKIWTSLETQTNSLRSRSKWRWRKGVDISKAVRVREEGEEDGRGRVMRDEKCKGEWGGEV